MGSVCRTPHSKFACRKTTHARMARQTPYEVHQSRNMLPNQHDACQSSCPFLGNSIHSIKGSAGLTCDAAEIAQQPQHLTHLAYFPFEGHLGLVLPLEQRCIPSPCTPLTTIVPASMTSEGRDGRLEPPKLHALSLSLSVSLLHMRAPSRVPAD